MYIGIVSDLHGNLAGWQRALELLRGCQVLLCPGDLLYHGPRFDPVESYNPRALAEAINNCGVPLLIARGKSAYAMVDAGVLHLYGRGLGDFLRKQTRRIKDYLHYRGKGERHYPWGRLPWPARFPSLT